MFFLLNAEIVKLFNIEIVLETFQLFFLNFYLIKGF